MSSHEAHAWGQIIAALSRNADVQQAADEAVGDCVHCWKAIAHRLANETVMALSARLGEPQLIRDDAGVVWGLNGDIVYWIGAMARLATAPPEWPLA